MTASRIAPKPDKNGHIRGADHFEVFWISLNSALTSAGLELPYEAAHRRWVHALSVSIVEAVPIGPDSPEADQ